MNGINCIEYLEWRYAVKKFDANKMLSDDKLVQLKKAFNLTATSYGLQPIKMVIVNNKELQKSLLPFTMGQLQVVQASHVLVICIEKNVDSNFIDDYFKKVKQERGTTDDVLSTFKNSLISDFSTKEIAEIEAWAKNQAYLALGNLITVCAIEQIDACPMEGFSPEGYDKLLQLEEKDLTSVLVMPIGYRADDDFFSSLKKVRRNIDDSIIEIE